MCFCMYIKLKPPQVIGLQRFYLVVWRRGRGTPTPYIYFTENQFYKIEILRNSVTFYAQSVSDLSHLHCKITKKI